MTFCYEENPVRNYSGVSVNDMDASRLYLTHMANKFYLEFISKNTETSFQERMQAEKELQTCERKLSFWKKHHNFDPKIVEEGIKKLKMEWQI